MASNNIFKLWQETAAARPIPKDIVRSMHFSVLPQATRSMTGEKLHALYYELQDFVLYECKGSTESLIDLHLPFFNTAILWLGIQLQGNSTLPHGGINESGTFTAFILPEEDSCLTLTAEKQWLLFIGVKGAAQQQLLAEIAPLRARIEQQVRDYRTVRLSYRERQLLDNLRKLSFGPFSSLHHIGQLALKLYSNYVDLYQQQSEQIKEEAQIQLYHAAMAYIRKHFMEKNLTAERIAEALNCSTRSLHRVFEGRSASINVTILTLRIYKGRELLAQHPEHTIDQIARELHFYDVSHFSSNYKKHFHQTPREERKKIINRKL
ncbi:helix-turn-helix domain-containing protein [Sphingobacterium sp. LRF_L2]|uniref:helix-turn-helix domain-containing protein n=1 Tax=Sphingobacterium sp. LRF_L2 TaxID=3369421 RepID=UPI003F5DAC77